MAGATEWQAWLARHGPAMLLLARQWVTPRADAEDVVQDAFLRFWRSPERVNGSVADPVAYLFTCVKRSALDWRRGTGRRVRRENDVALARPAPSVDSPLLSASMEREERRRLIEAALALLPEPQREVLVLKVWAGLTFPQIGQALDVPPDTAASRYRYALARMREQLAEAFIP